MPDHRRRPRDGRLSLRRDRGWDLGRTPTYRELTAAVASAGLEPRRVRAWPTQDEIAGLYLQATIAADEYVLTHVPDLDEVVVRALVGTDDPARPGMGLVGSRPGDAPGAAPGHLNPLREARADGREAPQCRRRSAFLGDRLRFGLVRPFVRILVDDDQAERLPRRDADRRALLGRPRPHPRIQLRRMLDLARCARSASTLRPIVAVTSTRTVGWFDQKR